MDARTFSSFKVAEALVYGRSLSNGEPEMGFTVWSHYNGALCRSYYVYGASLRAVMGYPGVPIGSRGSNGRVLLSCP